MDARQEFGGSDETEAGSKVNTDTRITMRASVPTPPSIQPPFAHLLIHPSSCPSTALSDLPPKYGVCSRQVCANVQMSSVTSDLVPQTLGGNDGDLIADALVDLEVQAELGVVSTVIISNYSQTHLPSCSMFSSLDLNVSPSTRVRTIVEDSKRAEVMTAKEGRSVWERCAYRSMMTLADFLTVFVRTRPMIADFGG
jgi:hypothetical protein